MPSIRLILFFFFSEKVFLNFFKFYIVLIMLISKINFKKLKIYHLRFLLLFLRLFGNMIYNIFLKCISIKNTCFFIYIYIYYLITKP